MKKRKIIGPLIPFSPVIMGTDHMGKEIPSALAFKLLDLYVSKGGNVFDTAFSYSFEKGESLSQQIVGSFIRKNGLKKNSVVMSKGGRQIEPLNTFLSRIQKEYERSCQELGFAPDVWFLHRDPKEIPVSEIMDCLKSFLGDTVLGLSNWSPSRFEQALSYKAPRPEISEIQFSLAPSSPQQQQDMSLVCMNRENFDFYSRTQIPVAAFSSQAKGYYPKLLAGKPLSQKAQERFDGPEARLRLRPLKAFSFDLKADPAALGVAYLASFKAFPVFPIVGASNASQLEQSLQGGEIELNEDQIARLNLGKGF